MKVLLRKAIYLTVALTLGGTLWQGWKFGISVLAGALLMWINLLWMDQAVGRLVGAEQPRADAWVAIKYMLRLVLIFGVLFAMIRVSFLSLPGAVLGLSVFVLSGMWEAVALLVKELRRAP